MAELPFQAEYAKSSRASCKGCKNKIDQGTLRLAAMVQSAFFDGKQANWYHEDCFFEKQRPKAVTDIGNLNSLRNPDQKRLKETIDNMGSGVVLPIEKGKGKGKGKKRAAENGSAATAAALKDFGVEYSKSSRATCCGCDLKIIKGEVRVSKKVFDTEVGQKFGGQPLWHHPKCFTENRSTLMFFASGEHLPGFKALTKEDKELIKETIPAIKSDEVPIKKLKDEPKDATEIKEEKALEKKLDKQTDNFHKYRKRLATLSKNDVQEILEANSQAVPPGIDRCLDHLADCMTFGSLLPCKVCKEGQLYLNTHGYVCSGELTEWTKCTNVTQKPERVPLKVPSAYKQGSVFKGYKPKVTERLFAIGLAPSTSFVKVESEIKQIKSDKPVPPLKNLQFFIYGLSPALKEEIKNKILKMGGIVASRLTENIAAVISNAKSVDRMNDKMAEIQDKDIQVVEADFVDLIDKEKGTIAESLNLILEKNIAGWGSDPKNRVPQDVVDGKSIPKSGSIYKSSKSGVTKLKLKGGSAVDPDSGLADEAHVYKDHDGTKWSSVLGLTDIVAQKNSYYKLQLLESDNKKKYWLFRSWGRIGTKVGGNKVETCRDLEDAQMKFENFYMDKTENPWEFRDHFVKVPGKMYPIDVDYGDDSSKTVEIKEDENCKLMMPVQQLIKLIFDVNTMKKVLLEFELDTDKMPLGKLSKKQVKGAYKVLTELQKLIEAADKSNKPLDIMRVTDATNRFFTMIPHDFGTNNAPLLNNVEIIKQKTDMLDNLLEIEIAYSMLSDGNEDTKISPIESHYLKLKTEIVPLDRSSPEFELLEKYAQNTHAKTHSQYTLTIQEVFKVMRDGEDKRYKPFKKLPNRRLLWHGSRVTNFAGILSQGLRIAPPEAPVTGYMFGKGIYFADMVSKSANYCATSRSSPTGVLLLCEVALGKMKECLQAEYVTSLPAGHHSVWGRGQTQPDPSQAHVRPDGTLLPLGTPVSTNVKSSLLYNEFIVYDVAQVHVQYLFQMKFDFKF